LVPVTVTCVAFADVTVRVDELPVEIAPGFAEIVTLGAVAAPVEFPLNVAPQPVISRDKQRHKNAGALQPEPERKRATLASNKVFSFRAAA
jgi:hypothetical protein